MRNTRVTTKMVMKHSFHQCGTAQRFGTSGPASAFHLGQGLDEYKKPQEFFRRTYLTGSLKRLLVSGVQRISAKGGDPVVQLQTTFGEALWFWTAHLSRDPQACHARCDGDGSAVPRI